MENRNKPAFATDNLMQDVSGLTKEEYATIEFIKAILSTDTGIRHELLDTGEFPSKYENIVLACKALARNAVMNNAEREKSRQSYNLKS